MEEFTVLIIDDDIWMQRILSRTLQSYGFKTTFLASNGFDGIALAVEHLPALIIMDILMPELSGHLTLKVLKSIKSTKSIPVLMVSALSDTENLGLAVKSGTSGFISKPFTRATVYEKLIGIFGKDKIDMLSRNEMLDNLYESGLNKSVFDTSDVTGEKDDSDEEQPQTQPAAAGGEVQAQSAKPFVSHDQLLHHYQENEKRSIDSIKKLLQKTKK